MEGEGSFHQQRSNSSLSFREQLIREYVILPDILTSIPIDVYLRFAETLFDDGKQSYEQQDLSRAYVQKKKFVTFVLHKLPIHQDWNIKKHTKAALLRAADASLKELEDIVTSMDANEDSCREEANRLLLIDEFDGVEHDDNNTPAILSCLLKDEERRYLLPYHKVISSSFDWLQPKDCTKDEGKEVLQETIFGQQEGHTTDNTELSTTLTAVASAPPLTTAWNLFQETGIIYSERVQCEKDIIRFLVQRNAHRFFFIPAPHSTPVTIIIGNVSIHLLRDDFHVQFAPFLRDIPVALQLSESAIETNRCFFLHLGVAMHIHPFLLQAGFRRMTQIILGLSEDDMASDLLSSVTAYAGYVDANCLCYLWPEEFKPYRICFVSGSFTAPIFSCFYNKDAVIQSDVLIHCNGQHFTLLRQPLLPGQPSISLDELLAAARKANRIVQIHEIDVARRWLLSQMILEIVS